jgi:hypothetical protein
MIKKLFSVLLIAVTSLTMNAQSVGLVGDFNSWGNDLILTSSDGENYTGQVNFLAAGGAKFRQDADWAVNWGTAAFPCGTGTQGGANIPYQPGTYDITFVKSTGAYCFNVVQTNFDTIHFFGGFNQNVTPGETMATTNGTDYVKIDFHFTAAGAKFYRSAPTVTTWGGTAFPSGTATVDGPTIPVTTGFYNVDLNITNGNYNFVEVPVSLIGNGVTTWSTDFPLFSTDGGITFSRENVELFSGQVKFRANGSWATNWGGTSFPNGTGVPNGNDNINVTPGIYTVTFNRLTAEYTFTLTQATVDNITFAGATLATADGENYTLNNQIINPGFGATAFQFNNVTTNQLYGGTTFPSGTAVLNAGPIPVVPGFYNVTFNKTTLAYAFSVTPVGIIGDATPGGWGADTPMTSANNGVTYTLNNVTLTDGALKFRTNSDWAFNWGGTAFPTGTGVFNGQDNIPVTAGTYDITFTPGTTEYVFTSLSSESFNNSLFSIYPNPATDSFRIVGEFDQVQIFNISGQLVKSYSNADTLSVADLNAGIYMVKVTGEAGTSVKKLIKK